jgi:hypothetical protein
MPGHSWVTPGLAMWVMVMMTVMMTGLSRQYNARKHCQRDDGEHQVTNLHRELLLKPSFANPTASTTRLPVRTTFPVNSFPQIDEVHPLVRQ